jgi:hypothetical protein
VSGAWGGAGLQAGVVGMGWVRGNRVLDVIFAMSSYAVLPDAALKAGSDSEIEKLQLGAFFQTVSRGYHLVNGSEDQLCESISIRLKNIYKKNLDIEKIRKVISDLSMDDSGKRKISLWSGGPRSLIFQLNGCLMLDLVGIPAYLRSLFCFMRDSEGASGAQFEQIFRNALERRGFEVKSGQLIASDGTRRELDAGVQVGGKLFLFECVSIELPLDYEISRFRTLELRRIRLEEKLDQARSLCDFVAKNPKGRNYDFSSAKEFCWIVVSPFVEWIWSTNEYLWLDETTPRILAPNEVFHILGR